MVIFYCDHFVLPLPNDHRFPMSKYALLRQRVAAAEIVPPQDLREPHSATDTELRRAHSADYVARATTGQLSEREIRRIGFPWSEAMIERSRRSSGATLDACREALAGAAIGVNLAGGTHHAGPDHGEGYCVFNDSAVAARGAQAEGLIQRALIVDLDVHQGNGTAAILQGDSSIYTLSLHGEHNFPFRKSQSDLDIGFDNGVGDDEYLETLRDVLPFVLDQSMPDLLIYVAGADPYVGDSLGKLDLSKAGLAERDRTVYGFAKSHGLPMSVSMAGGYAPNVEDIVDIHFQTVTLAAESLGLGPKLKSAQRQAGLPNA